MGERPQRAWLGERLESRAQKLVAVAAGITTVIGVPLAINALIETFWRDDSVAIPRSATLTVGKPEDIGLTWGGFKERYRDEVPRSGYSRAQLGVSGLVLPVRIEATGLADKTATVRWSVVNPTRGVGNFNPPSWVPRSREVHPSSSPATIVVHVWVPPSEILEEEIVRFRFTDDRDAELASEDSELLQREPD